MILAILFAYLGYKRANNVGRNGILWALIAAGAFIGTQIIVGLSIGVAMGIGVEFFDWSESVFTDYEILYTIIAIVISFGAGFIALKFADRPLVEEKVINNPPPPPNFNQSNQI